MRSVGPTRKVAKGGESGWEAGGVSRARSAAGGGPEARVAAPSGPGAGGAMRRVTLFLNGSPRNGKVSGDRGATRGPLQFPTVPGSPATGAPRRRCHLSGGPRSPSTFLRHRPALTRAE